MSPRRVHLMRAADLTAVTPAAAGFYFRGLGDSDHAWKLVTARVVCEPRTHHEGAFLPEVVTVKFADGTEGFFNPDDRVEIGPG
jgi:hypothetical protein